MVEEQKLACIRLYKSAHDPISISGKISTSIDHFQKIFECQLIVETALCSYHTLVSKALFNLKPAVRSPLTNGEFQPDRPIQLN